MKRVPWVPGTTANPAAVRSEPTQAPEVRRAVWIARKRAEVAAEITRLELAQRVRGTVDQREAFELARLRFLDWCVAADVAALVARRSELMVALGPDTVAALNMGALRMSDVTPAVADDLAALSILDRLLSMRGR